MSTDYLLRIPKPRTEVHRQNPGRATIGDTAEARLEPGLLDLLSSPVASATLPLGAGILPENLTAFAIAATAAALVAGEQDRKRLPLSWRGGEIELTWTRPARPGETLIGRARLSEMRRFTLHVDMETSSAETAETIMTGQIRLVAVLEGRALRLTPSLLKFEQAGPETGSAQPPGRSPTAALSLREAFRRLRARARRPG